MLHGGDNYRFVRVEEFGYVSSYNPRLLAGDIQTMVDVSASVWFNLDGGGLQSF